MIEQCTPDTIDSAWENAQAANEAFDRIQLVDAHIRHLLTVHDMQLPGVAIDDRAYAELGRRRHQAIADHTTALDKAAGVMAAPDSPFATLHPESVIVPLHTATPLLTRLRITADVTVDSQTYAEVAPAARTQVTTALRMFADERALTVRTDRYDWLSGNERLERQLDMDIQELLAGLIAETPVVSRIANALQQQGIMSLRGVLVAGRDRVADIRNLRHTSLDTLESVIRHLDPRLVWEPAPTPEDIVLLCASLDRVPACAIDGGYGLRQQSVPDVLTMDRAVLGRALAPTSDGRQRRVDYAATDTFRRQAQRFAAAFQNVANTSDLNWLYAEPEKLNCREERTQILGSMALRPASEAAPVTTEADQYLDTQLASLLASPAVGGTPVAQRLSTWLRYSGVTTLRGVLVKGSEDILAVRHVNTKTMGILEKAIEHVGPHLTWHPKPSTAYIAGLCTSLDRVPACVLGEYIGLGHDSLQHVLDMNHTELAQRVAQRSTWRGKPLPPDYGEADRVLEQAQQFAADFMLSAS